MKNPMIPKDFLELVKDKSFTKQVHVLKVQIDEGLKRAIRDIEDNVAENPEQAIKSPEYFDKSYATELAYTLFIAGFHWASKRVYEVCLRKTAELEKEYGKTFNKETLFANYGVAQAQCGDYFEAIGYLSLAEKESQKTSSLKESFGSKQIEKYLSQILKPEALKIFKAYFLDKLVKQRIFDYELMNRFWEEAPRNITNWLSISMLQWKSNVDSPHPINKLGSWFAILLATRTLENLIIPYTETEDSFFNRLKKANLSFEQVHKEWKDKYEMEWEGKEEKKYLLKLATSLPEDRLTAPIDVHIARSYLVAQQARNFVSHCNADELSSCEINTWDVMTLVCFAIIGTFILKTEVCPGKPCPHTPS